MRASIFLFPFKNIIKFTLNIYLLFILLKYSIEEEECEKERPIKKNNNCELTYCSAAEFTGEICKISNSIAKTQWLTNIIKVGDNYYRLLNFALSSKNDLIMQTRPYNQTSVVSCYGVKSNGKPLFNGNGHLKSIINIGGYVWSNNYGEIFLTIPKNSKKEFIVYFGKKSDNLVLLDYENQSYFRVLINFRILTKRFFLQSLEKNDNFFYFAFIGKLNNNDDKNYFFIFKCQFVEDSVNQVMNLNLLTIISKENLNNHKNMLSCYLSARKNVVCFYYSKNLNYTALLYDENLNEKNSFDFGRPSIYTDLFFKCIHFKDEMGIFYYFLSENVKPIIDIVDFVEDKQTSNFIMKYKFKSLTTKNDNVKPYLHLNSIIKVNDNKFGIIQVSNDRELIYIIIYNIFNQDSEIIARYYTINIYQLYNKKVAKDVESIMFNSFFVSAFSFYLGNDDSVPSANIIIFSYPIANDYEINLINHLKENNYTFTLNEIINNNIIIENNIFGLVTKGITFQQFPQVDKEIIIKIYSNQKKVIINKNQIIDKDEQIEFFFPKDTINTNNYVIEYAGVLTEPDFDDFNLYCEIDSSQGNINNEKKEFKKKNYIGKTGSIILNVEESLTNDCNDKNCFYCLEGNRGNCILYKKPDNCSNENDLDTKELSIIYSKLMEIIEEKTFDDKPIILNMKDVLMQLSTIDFQEDDIKNQNSTNVFLGQCKEILKEKYNLKDNEVLMMLKLDLFKQNSSTPLVEYEIYNYNNTEKLNLEYCKDVKINIYFPIKLENQTIVLYNNLNVSGYNLFDEDDSFYNDICSPFTTINGTDITLVDRKKIYYNNSLKLCPEDGCTYDYYDSELNKVKCDCPISKISIDKKEDEQSENSFISTIIEIYNNKQIIKKIFAQSIDNMNFQVMKCFELVFKLKYFIKNIGCILLTILILLYLFFMILYLIYGNKILKKIMNEAFSKKHFNKRKGSVRFKDDFDKKDNKGKKPSRQKSKSIVNSLSEISFKTKLVRNNSLIDNNNENVDKNINKENNSIINNNVVVFQRRKGKKLTAKPQCIKLKLKLNPPPKSEKKHSLNIERKKNKSKTLKINKQLIINQLEKMINGEPKKEKIKKQASIENNSNINSNSELIFNQRNKNEENTIRKSSFSNKYIKEKKDQKDNKLKVFDYLKVKERFMPKAENLNDEELNSLDYEIAVIIDKRTFMEFYWSLLKKRHLILFAFYPVNDYNIMIIKVSFFIVSFSLYMTINGFFFSDETMHKVYEDNGEFNFIYQIPQILYSTIVSMFINKLLKYLSLSEKSILDLKKEKGKKTANEKLVNMEKCLKRKLVIYFIIGFSLMFFFWYFISTFCAVYSNTQIILIKNTLISFGLSMIYPFGYVLLPGFFRIPALRAKNQDKEFLYKLSKIIALI